ncbi:hydrogenase assembly chaperone HypC/HupF [Xenococcus sp. PCC 7305]|uniref:HypC/HybG/HupF family hydrogenase formation chaperone n=1 Tax=Xenococcus sp. PCC 7305 TaxID=102125 RepID=UPI0002AC24B2|nr:HypC/HybG/HupF family hydrogenase formation chaperone [Xenococcus sp. PCC 7305]ELS00795.1 hydrogenase assembly chaperone HypC/HupF [Xenococcus sp. PCC 7305]
MCLAVPGRIISISEDPALFKVGRVSFGGVIKQISLAYVPEAKVDDYVIVHAGFALTILDPEEAKKTLNYIKQIETISQGNIQN